MANGPAHFVLALVLALLPAAWPAAASQHGMVFECRQPGLAPSYLMGTMHTSDARVLAVADAAESRLRGARRLVLETVPDGASLAATMRAGFLPEGQSLDGLLEPGLLERVLEVARARGLPPPVVLRMRPWALATTLSLPPDETGLFLDLRLYHLAQEAGVEVVGLETAQEQLALFEGLTTGEQATLLAQALEIQPRLPQEFDDMVAAYLAGDLAMLQRLSERQQAELGDGLGAWFQGTLIEARNRRMAERLQPAIAAGGAFVAVGALHLTGETGLLASLERMGCALSVLR